MCILIKCINNIQTETCITGNKTNLSKNRLMTASVFITVTVIKMSNKLSIKLSNLVYRSFLHALIISVIYKQPIINLGLLLTCILACYTDFEGNA